MVSINNERVNQLLTTAPFQIAKSIQNIPHSYTLKKNWVNSKEFEEVVSFIYRNGVKELFYSKEYTYYYYGDYKYWAMGWSPEETELINRAEAIKEIN